MEVASPQLRNQGTIGGNLCQKPRCWYYRGEFHCLRKGGETCFAITGENQYHCIFGGDGCYIVHPSDMAPALVALNATVRVAGPNGTRAVAVEQFFMPPAKDPKKETILDAGRDRYRGSSACAAEGLAQFLPEGAGAPLLGLCSCQPCFSADHKRQASCERAGRARRRGACAMAFSRSRGGNHGQNARCGDYRKGSRCSRQQGSAHGAQPLQTFAFSRGD